ncbi:hypothetical protein DFJ73DRAFT_283409 [Zopfochytrium polystomum]|nr:hypothetical protein DFJ73DRAFT_283409 [Zopfochytrium polystomum]
MRWLAFLAFFFPLSTDFIFFLCFHLVWLGDRQVLSSFRPPVCRRHFIASLNPLPSRLSVQFFFCPKLALRPILSAQRAFSPLKTRTTFQPEHTCFPFFLFFFFLFFPPLSFFLPLFFPYSFSVAPLLSAPTVTTHTFTFVFSVFLLSPLPCKPCPPPPPPPPPPPV